MQGRRPIEANRIHAVVVSIGSAGDLFPMLAMALALRDAGHKVSFLAPGQFQEQVAPTGLAFHALAVDEAVLDDPGLWDARKGFGVVWRATRAAAAQLPAFVDTLPASEPCVLLVHPLVLPEADLCRAARPDIRIACACLAPSNLPTVHDPLTLGPLRIPPWMPFIVRRWLWRRAGASLIDPVALPGINDARRQRGLPAVRSLLTWMFTVPDLTIALFPEWYARTQPDWPRPLLHAGFPLYDPDPGRAIDPELARFLDAGHAPIAFTPGTGNRQAAQFFASALTAAHKLGRRALFLTPHRDQLPSALPAGVLWRDYVPLAALLPRVAALVHHGGIGTTAEALRTATPQLVAPFAHDQFDNAARVAALGVGQVLPGARLDAARLERSLRELLSSPHVTAQCEAVALRFGQGPALGAACAALAGLPLPTQSVRP